MDEDIKYNLKMAIKTSFDKWNTNYLQKLNEQRRGNNWNEDKDEAYLLDLFLLKRVFIYGFYRHVSREVQNNSVAQRQRKILLRAIVQSILNESGVTVKDLEKNIDSKEGYTYTHTRRVIKDDYPEVFMESEKKKKDSRFNPFRTVFSPHDLPEEYKVRLLDTIDSTYHQMKSRPDLTEWMILNAGIMPVTPEYLLDLKNFLNDVQEILKETQTATNVKRVLQNEMKGLTEISGEFSNHYQSIMAVEWWRNRREKTKRRLIDNGFPLKYTRADATQAHKLLLEITKNTEHVYSIMFGSAMTFDKRDLHKPAQFMYEECLKTGFPSPLHRGILHENLAVMLRKQNKPKLMVREMKKAIEEYREANNDYRVCVGLKNLGEAEWKLGFKETGKRYFIEAETLSNRLEQSEKADVLWNLAYAARRIKEKKMECNYLIKCISTCTDDQTNLVIECENRMSQLQC